MKYRIEYTEKSLRALRELDRSTARRIVAKIEKLAEQPRAAGAVKLSGHDAYRIRVGDYRVIYAVLDDQLVVLVVEIGNRCDVYRNW